MKHLSQFLFLILCLGLSAACVSETKRAKISDGGSTTEGEIARRDSFFSQPNVIEISGGAPSRRRQSFVGEKRGGSNFSELIAMIDGFGNKIEHRCFDSHPRLRCIVLSTQTNGAQKAQAFAKNGRIFNLPLEMIENSLTDSPNEIADALNVPEPPPPAVMTELPLIDDTTLAAAQVMPFTTPDAAAAAPPEPEIAADPKQIEEIQPAAPIPAAPAPPPVLATRRDRLLMTSSGNEVFKSARVAKLK